MILRRFMQHTKEQNWFAVGLDVIVVIVGIFLGMQVTEWNQHRLDRKLEKEYLERILGDLNASIERQKQDISFLKENYDAFEFVLDALTKGQLDANEQTKFNQGLTMGGRANPIQYVQTTVLELQSTGQMRLIQNINVRKSLSELNAFHHYKSVQMEYPNQSLSDSQSKMKDYFFTNWEQVGDYDFLELSHSKVFKRHANFMQTNYATIRLFHNQFHKDTQATREHVKSYLVLLEANN